MITHLSISQLNMFSRCPEQWRRRYLEEEIIPPGIAAHVGSGVHKAAELNYRQKISSGEDLPLDTVQDAAAEAYDKALSNGVFIPREEAAGARSAMAEGKDTAVSLAAVYRQQLAPQVTPKLVEEKIFVTLPGVDLPLLTILDCYDAAGNLRDLKTAGKKWTQSKADTSLQPTAYREAVKQATGAYPRGYVFDVLVNTKNKELQTLETAREAADTAALAMRCRAMLMTIEAGIFGPAEPDSWMCSPRFCGYYGSCRYVPAHKKILPNRS